MAEPFDSAWILEDASAIFQTQYFKEFTEEAPGRFGLTTNKLFKPSMEEVSGNGKTLQFELAPGDTVRTGSDPLGALASPDAFEAATLQVRFNKQTPTSSDFTFISASCQTTDIDVEQAAKGTIIPFVDRMYKEIQPEYEESLAIHRHLTRTALLALVNGTPVQNDREYFAAGAATPTNTTGMRIAVDNGSIAYFRRGRRIDFVNPSTGAYRAQNCRVTDVNPSDLSVGVEFKSTGHPTQISSGDISTVADNDQIYLAGEKDAGMYSLGAYMGRPAATGDSFIGGVNRMTPANRWLLTTATREGATATSIAKSHFNDLAVAMGFRDESGVGGVFIQAPQIHERLREVIGEDAFIQLPTGDERLKRFGHFGSVGLIYQHGVFGVVQLLADPLATPNTVRFIVPETWRTLFYGHRGLKGVQGTKGFWYRLNQSAPNTGDSLVWKADFYANQMDFCMKPWMNGNILNITA